MKERIVITQDWLVKDMKAGVVETDKLFICQKVEQVPTTFDELKEMCADLDGETSDISCNILQDEIDISVWNTDNQTKVGDIEFLWWVDTLKMSFGTGLSVDISVPRAWQIIKSLIGDER